MAKRVVLELSSSINFVYSLSSRSRLPLITLLKTLFFIRVTPRLFPQGRTVEILNALGS